MPREQGASSIEWTIFQNLGWYVNGRLQPLKRSNGERSSKNRLERKRRVLEFDLRHALLLGNANINSPGDLSCEPLVRDGNECLVWIVQFLESHINRKFLATLSTSEIAGADRPFPTKSQRYTGLHQLIQYLKATTECSDSVIGPINLVLELDARPPMFSVYTLSEARQALNQATQLNAIFRKDQVQPNLNTKKRPKGSMKQEEACSTSTMLGLGFRKYTGVVLDALYRSLPCSDSHKVLLKFQKQEGALDLFLSGCKTNQWQEVQCEHYSPRNSIHKAHDLCQTLHQRADTRLQMMVEVIKDGCHHIHYSPQPSSRLYPETCPSKSLEDLIRSGCFRNINFKNSSSLPTERFNSKEKRTLAFQLGLHFLNFFDSRFMKESWNVAKIMLLILPRTKIQDGQLYMTCYLNESHQQDLYRPGHPVLTSFARLLLEIDEGDIWPGPSLDRNGISNSLATWVQLCTYIEDVKQDRGQNSYLDAVTRTLYLHKELNEVQGMSEAGENIDTKLREVMYTNVVRLLELEASPEARKRLKGDPAGLDNDATLNGINLNPPERIDRLGARSYQKNYGTASDFVYEHISDKISQIHSSKIHRTLQRSDLRDLELSPGFDQPHPSGLCQSSGVQTLESSVEGRAFPHPIVKTCDKFQIAMVCALPLEATAVQALFDEIYDEDSEEYRKNEGDQNAYTIGRIGKQNIVLCHLPGMGISGASSAAANLRMSYTNVKLVLIVGVCGAIPFLSDGKDIFLGDIIISDSAINHGFGRQYPDEFERKSGGEETLGFVDNQIKALLRKLETKRSNDKFREDTISILQTLQTGNSEKYHYPGVRNDILFPAEYLHEIHEGSQVNCPCPKCSKPGSICDMMRKMDCRALGCRRKEIRRKRLGDSDTLPSIHIGKIASADTVMKSGQHRDELAVREGVIGFEMEGAGVWGQLPCIVIKGVCDYADSHKNKKWQNYAAATAAAGAAAFLRFWSSNTRH
ncbi:hypothetical protein TWF718_000452 [Orbilia javanica]|uniref:Nucleoside phosphorylase domain-containing protein n=1 Tax=Orbilia javanica TaxID=47235 RepID=A0AAN8MX62_9PEZI